MTAPTPKPWTERWWPALLIALVALLALRSLPHAVTAINYPSYEETVCGNVAKDALEGGLVLGFFDYAYTPANSLTMGVLVTPLFALFGKLHLHLLLLAFVLAVASWLIVLAYVRHTDGAAAAWWLVPALLLLPDALAYAQVHASAPHREQFFWAVLQFVFLAEYAQRRRWWAATMFGLAAGIATFNVLANLVVVAATVAVAAMWLDKRRLAALLLWAGPAYAVVASLRLGLLRTDYGLLIGDAGGSGARLLMALQEGLPAVFGMGQPTTASRAVVGVLLAFWAALAILRRREIGTAVSNLPRRQARDIQPGAALDLWLVLLVPAWLAAVSLHGWGATAANWRYVTQLACVLILVPGRVAVLWRPGRWALLPLAGLLIAAITVWPSVAPFADADQRSFLVASARGNLGHYYPLFSKRSLAQRLMEAPTVDDRLALLARIQPPWRGWALRDAGRLAAYEGRAGLGLETAPLSPRLRQLWHEGVAFGLVERWMVTEDGSAAATLRELRRHLGVGDQHEAAITPGVYFGMGEVLLAAATGLGPPTEIDRWGATGQYTDSLFKRVGRARRLAARLDRSRAAWLARGMGHAAADQAPSRAAVDRFLITLLPDADPRGLLAAFFRGVGEGQARKALAMRRSWVSRDGRLCEHVPEEFTEVCAAGFTEEMRAFGLRVERGTRGEFTEYRLTPTDGREAQ